jgi:hypothetical protein
MKVRAIRECYYGDQRQKPGAVFELKSPKHFSAKGMEKLEDDAPVEKPKSKLKKQKGEVALSNAKEHGLVPAV